MAPLNPGDTLGRYRLVGSLGKGGMGEVFLAKAVGAGGFEKPVALKVLTPAGEASRKHLSSLQREALLGVHLDHDHVVQILDYGEEEGRHFVAMEYVRGHSLDHVLRHAADQDERVPLRVAVHVARTVATALRYVHNVRDAEGQPLGLIHGDVTPSNVMLSHDGRIKLTDFGIAALARELEGKEAVAGKPRYLPPEVLRGAPHTQAADVYALGVLLWELLASQPAFQGEAGETLSSKALQEAKLAGLPALGPRRPDCPAALDAVLGRATAGDPAARYATAEALWEGLNEAIPREVEDGEDLRAFVKALFGKASFVARCGLLPSTGSLGHSGKLAPHITEQTGATVSMPRALRPLRFGLSPALSGDVAREAGARLALLISDPLGREVHATVFADYRTLAQSLLQGDVDFAWTPPQIFVEVFEAGGGMLAIMERKGSITFEGALFVRTESPVVRLEDLRGQPVAWVDRQSTSGYLVPYAELLRTLGTEPPPLGRQHFHGSHRAVCEAVLNGWAVAGATYLIREAGGGVATTGWRDLVPDQAEELRVLATMGPIPGDNLCHSPELPLADVGALVDVLCHLHETELGTDVLLEVLGAERLVIGGLELYDTLQEALAVVRGVAGL